MKKTLAIVLALVMTMTMLLGLTGCGKPKPEDEVKTMFDLYAAAVTSENIENYMACIDSGSAEININSIKAAMQNMFDNYDLKATVDEIKINKIDETSATVTVTLKYENIGETAYVDNRVTGIYELTKKGENWLISNSTLQSVEYLDGQQVANEDITYSVPIEEVENASETDDTTTEQPTEQPTEATTTTTQAAAPEEAPAE